MEGEGDYNSQNPTENQLYPLTLSQPKLADARGQLSWPTSLLSLTEDRGCWLSGPCCVSWRLSWRQQAWFVDLLHHVGLNSVFGRAV